MGSEPPIARPLMGLRDRSVPAPQYRESRLRRTAFPVNPLPQSIPGNSVEKCRQRRPSFAERQRDFTVAAHLLNCERMVDAVGLEEGIHPFTRADSQDSAGLGCRKRLRTNALQYQRFERGTWQRLQVLPKILNQFFGHIESYLH